MVRNWNSSIYTQLPYVFIKLHGGVRQSMKRDRTTLSAGVNQHWHLRSYLEAHQLKLWPTVTRSVQPSFTPRVTLAGAEGRSGCNRHQAKSCSASPGSGNAFPDCGLKQPDGVLCTAWLRKVQYFLTGGLWYVNHVIGMISEQARW